MKSKKEKADEILLHLIDERIIYIAGDIDDTQANSIIARMLFLNSEAPNKDIYLFIDSPGGSVAASLAIYDTIQHIKTDMVTISRNLAGGIASLLLAAGTKGKRFALSDSNIALCQLTAKDYTHVKELARIKNSINELYANLTNKSINQIAAYTADCHSMSAYQALEYGFVELVIGENRANEPQPNPGSAVLGGQRQQPKPWDAVLGSQKQQPKPWDEALKKLKIINEIETNVGRDNFLSILRMA